MNRSTPLVLTLALIAGCSQHLQPYTFDTGDALPLDNQAPTVTWISHADGASIREAEEVVLTALVSDPETPVAELAVRWFSGDTEICVDALVSAEGLVECSVVPSLEDATFVVAVSDGELTSQAALSVDIYANTAPSAPAVVIAPDQPWAAEDSVQCVVQTPSVDVDDDPVSYAIHWELNGVAYDGPTLTTTLTGDTVAATSVSLDQRWTCVVTPDDGFDQGPSATAFVDTVCWTGVSPACGARSCWQVLQDGYSTGDGIYWLDPTGTEPLEYVCDMTTDGGGWTEVVAWDREHDGETIADLENELVFVTNEMGTYKETNETHLWWASNKPDAGSVLQAGKAVSIPNKGEYRFGLHFKGVDWERTGIWFGAMTDRSTEDLKCRDTETTGYPYYTAVQLAAIPYVCPENTGTLNQFEWDDVFSGSVSAGIVGFEMTSLMADKANADRSKLYHLDFWVR